MLLIAGTIRFPAEAMAAAREPIEAMVLATRAEDGCIEYRFAEDVIDPGLIHITERWRDAAALEAHFLTPHMRDWQAASAELGVSDRALTRYAVDEGQPL